MEEILEKQLGVPEDDYIKYNSIENHYRPEFIERLRLNGLENERWLITEKVHGSNTQVSYDGKKVSLGTRSHELVEGENCYNLQKVIQFCNIDNKIKEIYNEFRSTKSVEKVVLFGEICGGSYPHVEVLKDNHATRVQKGVFYSQHNEWLMFDILLIVNGKREYLSGKDFINIANKYCIATVPILGVANTLTEALSFDNAGKSVVATKLLGLPELNDNIMEGIVIRGYDRDTWTGQHRSIIKSKNDKFAEKSHEKKKVVEAKELPENVRAAIETASKYITVNRLDNVISHFGEVQLEDIGKIIGAMNKDVIDDFQKEEGLLNTMEKAEAKLVTKGINTQVAQLVRSELFKRLTTK